MSLIANKSELPRYQKIALDIANAIHKGDIKEGEKLHGRSTLAGRYNVSPETVRRSIKLLEDVEVVKSSRGSGITVLSRANALVYINKFQNIGSISYYRKNLLSLIKKKKDIDKEIVDNIDKIIDYSGRLSNTSPLTPLEIEIPQECEIIGKTINEVKFWQHTGATIVAIQRGASTILSPGPYAVFKEKDILILIGDDKVYNAARVFLNK